MVDEDKKQVEEKVKKETLKLDKTVSEAVTLISNMTVVQAAELAKTLAEKFGVAPAASVIAPLATGAAPTPTGEAETPEQTTFNVIMAATGANKISVIKALREINPQLGLKEAKDITDAPPKEILTGVNRATADEAKSKLEAAGASVELK